MKRLVWMLIAVAGVATVILLLRAPAPGAIGVGSKAPPLRAVTLAMPANAANIDDYRGQVVLLNVWATWCPPCRDEMPSMQTLHEELQHRGLRVVAVSIDDPGSQQDVRDFVAELQLTFEILHDPDATIMDAYQVGGVPQSFLIDRAGMIRFKIYATDWRAEQNRRRVEELLAEES
jgi:peroxiredoxin